VDVGGTFTDLFAWDPEAAEAHRVREAKVLSTPADPSIGFMQAIEAAGIDPAQIATVIHGTTIGTNALIERRYPEPALITTSGFRDVLEIGRQRRKHLYDPYQRKSPPLIARSRRFTVTEKLGADGSTVIPLDRDEARRVAEQLAELGISNVAIAFINAYRDGKHAPRSSRAGWTAPSPPRRSSCTACAPTPSSSQRSNARARWSAATCTRGSPTAASPTLEYDTEHSAELVHSLDEFLQANRSWQRAAKALFVHKQTLVYRMKRVEELTGRRLDDTGHVAELWFALRALELVQ
jgi:hypothetical protein